MQIKNDISIRSIQHYLYCAHRWGLIEIGKVWAENYFVTKANLIHQNVHEKSIYAKRGKKVFSAVSVYHWTIVNKKDTIFKYIFWERLDSLPIPECCFHFVWCQIA